MHGHSASVKNKALCREWQSLTNVTACPSALIVSSILRMPSTKGTTPSRINGIKHVGSPVFSRYSLDGTLPNGPIVRMSPTVAESRLILADPTTKPLLVANSACTDDVICFLWYHADIGRNKRIDNRVQAAVIQQRYISKPRDW